jgi:glycogen debranching enzyme
MSTTQPWLHDREVAVRGNVTCVSNEAGDIGPPGTGLYVDDRRVLSFLSVTFDTVTPVHVSSESAGGRTCVQAVLRHLGDPGNDPTVDLTRERVLHNSGMRERLVVTSRAAHVVNTVITVEVLGDGADISHVKGGAPVAPGLWAVLEAGGGASWEDDRHRTRVYLPGATVRLSGDEQAPGPVTIEYPIELLPGSFVAMELAVETTRTAASQFDAEPGSDRIDWSHVQVSAQDRRVDLLVDQSAADLTGLLLSDPDGASDVFAAAGSPWYLTLFGRDALWTARLMLPFGTDLAAGTLRTLARRQGRRTDPSSAEEPGKILHEVRRSGFSDPSSPLHLPPAYFGTVDATPLWICVLHDAWRWGLPVSELLHLRPALEGALQWLRASVDRSGDGFIRYVDTTGTGLSNQGWKDSGDSMRRRDGSIAPAPIALVETQAYAVSAACGAAAILEEVFGEPGQMWREWADELSVRVREKFWVKDRVGPYLAMALDAAGAPVDGVGSNMGHVLGTGMLSPAEEEVIAHRLADPDLLGAFGIRTLSRSNPAFNPIGYHTGSVWAHDSAIVAMGLAGARAQAPAAEIFRGLLDAAAHFDYRLPELFGGDSALHKPIPYGAACRPQAWAAAVAGGLVSAALGIRVDVPARQMWLDPIQPSPFGSLRVRGLRIGGDAVEVHVDATGAVSDVLAPSWLTVHTPPR